MKAGTKVTILVLLTVALTMGGSFIGVVLAYANHSRGALLAFVSVILIGVCGCSLAARIVDKEGDKK